MSNRGIDEYAIYVVVRNKVNAKIRQIKKDYWTNFTQEMESDIYGAQRKVWGMLKRARQGVNEYTQTNVIDENTWSTHFKKMYSQGNQLHYDRLFETVAHNTTITTEMTDEALRKLKNRKAAGQDKISNELLKYGGTDLSREFTKLFQMILTKGAVPKEWKSSITVPIFKKGDKKNPGNYRGITLLNTSMKLFTNTLKSIISNNIQLSEEQQGFRNNRSTTDAIFILRQIVEKSIEYDKPAYMCFIDLTKAFDRIRLNDVLLILNKKLVPADVIRIIKELNTQTKTRIRINNQLTEEIDVDTGIRQGDSLSPLLFNLIMDKIIQNVKNTSSGYRLGSKEIQIVCYADDAMIVAENEDNVQRLLHTFHNTAKDYNMEISIEKTKSVVISKEPRRCKLSIEGKTIEQVMSFKYLGIEISSNRNIKTEVKAQTNKAARISGCLRQLVWQNKTMSTEAKVKIYKTCVRPVMTYAADTRADNSVTKRYVRSTEMRILRNITGHTLRDRIRNDEIRQKCNVQDVVRWIRKRRREWNDHVTRMPNNRLPKIARDGGTGTSRPPGRPPKRWRDSWTSKSQE